MSLYTRADQPPQTGNPDAAQDLYGLGVRVGFYLQALGMILYNSGGDPNCGQGLKIASGSISVSILASWFVFAAQGDFSPSEAIIILLILISLSFPAKATLNNPKTILGESIGLMLIVIIELGICAASLWTFSSLVNTLPTLNTNNVVFFFAKVPLRGWFRYLILVYFVIDTITSFSFCYKMVKVTAISWAWYRHVTGGAEKEKLEKEKLEEKLQEIIGWKGMEGKIDVMKWMAWVLVIVAVELTLQWNHLSPSADIWAPGQLIPLITGVVIFIDSSFFAARHVLFGGRWRGQIRSTIINYDVLHHVIRPWGSVANGPLEIVVGGFKLHIANNFPRPSQPIVTPPFHSFLPTVAPPPDIHS